MRKWYREIDRRFSWSFFGFLIGIIGVVFGLYSILHQEKPNVEFEVLTNTDVLNVTEEISKLQILFDNESVLSMDTTLKLLTIRLSNTGNSITKNDFDEEYPIGLNFKNFIIVESPSAIEFSNIYLEKRFRFSFDSTTIRIDPIILDKNDYVILKLLLIGAKKENVKISSFGKVAGQDKIQILTETNPKKIKPGWNILKTSLILIALAFVYGLVFPFLETLKDLFIRRKRKRKIKKFKSQLNIEEDKLQTMIFRFYIDYSKSILSFILSLSENQERFEKFAAVDVHSKGLTYEDLKFMRIKLDSSTDLSNRIMSKSFYDELLLENNVIVNEGGKAKFSEGFIDRVKKLLQYIEN